MAFYKPRAAFQLDVAPFGTNTNFITIHPAPIEVKWTKNHHLAADECTVTIGYEEGGIDPRMLKSARGAVWIWDDAFEEFNKEAHLRFTGICVKVTRKLSENGWVVDLSFRDWTDMFLRMKPFPDRGIAEWTDNLTVAWEKLCDHTGWRDPNDATGIISSVKALRGEIKFANPSWASRIIGEAVPERFHAISKPQPKMGADAWGVWQWIVGSLGLVSYIDRGRCVVTDSNEIYKEEHAVQLIYGQNILEFEEHAEPGLSNKGILLKSFDPVRGVVIEGRYPPPGDERIKKKRADVKRALKEGRSDTRPEDIDKSANETSHEYEEFTYNSITDPAALEERAYQAYEERSRQELKGKIKTTEMRLPTRDGDEVDVMSLNSGDCLAIGVDDRARDIVKLDESEDERVRRLILSCGYIPEVARLVVRSMNEKALRNNTFHVSTIDVELTADSYSVTLDYHNKIYIPG